MAILSSVLLGLIDHQGPVHGYALKNGVEQRFGADDGVNAGQIYSTLARLRRDGLVRRDGEESGGGPNRKLYSLTASGSEVLTAWLTEPEEPEPEDQPRLFAKVVIALLTSRDPFVYLDRQRALHLRKMRELTELKRSGHAADRLRADYGLFHLEADLRWMEVTSARIEPLRQALSDG